MIAMQTSPQGDDDASSITPLPYDLSPEFNEYLVSNLQIGNDGIIRWNGSTYWASEILYQTDRAAYANALVGFRQNFKNTVMSSFPTPLANRLYRIEKRSRYSGQQFSMLKDFWEALIHILYGFIMGEALTKSIGLLGAQQPNATRTNKQLIMDDLLSDKLAVRLSVIAGVLEFEGQQGTSTKAQSLIPIDVIRQIRSLHDERNGFAHNPTMSNTEAQEAFEKCYPKVLSICQKLVWLQDVQFMRLENASDMLNPEFEIYAGHAQPVEIRSVPLTRQQVADSLAFLNPNHIVVKIDDEIYNISPFLHFVTRSHDDLTKLCGLKQRAKGAPDYEFMVFDESKPEQIAQSIFKAEVDLLRKLLTTAPAQGNHP